MVCYEVGWGGVGWGWGRMGQGGWVGGWGSHLISLQQTITVCIKLLEEGFHLLLHLREVEAVAVEVAVQVARAVAAEARPACWRACAAAQQEGQPSAAA